MSQLCPACSFDNPDDGEKCNQCGSQLRGLLGEKTLLSNRYELVSVLGCGAMGAVYLADDRRLAGRRCAIKENRPNLNTTAEIRTQSQEQFMTEASILARLDHPNLPKVSDYFAENGRAYLVMDYVEGESLDSYIQRSKAPLDEATVLDWTDQLLDALIYLHNQQPQPIIHRDIKPANLRLNLQGRIKLVDFGLVKLLDADNPHTRVELRGLGTPAYAPLEQFAGSQEHTDARSDIYSLGATMYHLLTYQAPPEVHQRLLNLENLTPPGELNANLSEKTVQIIQRAMGVHPSERYQSAEEMRQATAQARQQLATPGNKQTKSSPIISPVAVGLVGLALVLVILGTVAFLLFRNFNQNPTAAQATTGANPAANGTANPALAAPSTAEPDTPTATRVIDVTPLSDALSAPTSSPAPAETETPTPPPTSSPTSPPRQAAAPPGDIPAATLAGTIAYPVFNGSSYDLYFGQADGTGTEFIRADASQPAFSPDGNRLAYRSWAIDSRGLMTMNSDGSNPRQITKFVEDQLPAWSADGSQIVLMTRRSGDRKSQLIKISSGGENNNGQIISEGEYPALGPNNELAFKGWGVSGIGLRLSTLAMEDLQPLTNLNEDTAPAISPDGQTVAFMSRRDGNWEIYTINSDGTNPQRLTETPAQEGLPTWSPDGRAIAFVSDRDGAWAVWAMAPTGANPQRLFTIEGSPDGFVGTDTFASRGWAEERMSWTR